MMSQWSWLPSWSGTKETDASEKEAKEQTDEAPAAAKDANVNSPAKPSHSRSTSIGSTRSPSCAATSTTASPVKAKVSGLPDIEYPSPLNVQNTFLNVPTARPASLDAFYEERGFRSCPSSAIGVPPGLLQSTASEGAQEGEDEAEEDEDDFVPKKNLEFDGKLDGKPREDKSVLEIAGEDRSSQPGPSPLPSPLNAGLPMYWPRTMSADGLEDFMASINTVIPALPAAQPTDAAAARMLVPPPPTQRAPEFLPPQHMPPPPPAAAQEDGAETPVPLRLAQVFPEPELGSPELPTVGSRGHRLGTCRPCAFLYTKGCANNTECDFCHLCEPGEKKRRSKQRQSDRRDAKQHIPSTAYAPPFMPVMGGSPLQAMQQHVDYDYRHHHFAR